MNNYRQSRFAVAVPVATAKEKMIAVYHTLTRAFSLLHESVWASLLGNRSEGVDSETRTKLVEQGILVCKDTDESALFDVRFQQHVHDYSHMRSKTMVTRRCTNGCVYCIIDLEAEVMSAETARAMDAFYLDQIACHCPKRVTDAYSGGEPLLNLKIIVESASRRYYFCLGKGIDYGFFITTNGTLLTPEVITQLKDFGLVAVRVSLAGPADVNDQLRPSVKDRGTYHPIMENMASVSGMVPLTIECQYDAGSDDFTRIPEMMDDLLLREISISDIAFTPILAKRSNNRFHAGMGEPEQMQFLQKAALERGLTAVVEAPSNACQADFRAFYVFDTNGSIIPCSSLQCGEMAYGHVSTGIDFTAESQMLARRLPEQCTAHCELLPVCTGGCRIQAMAHGGCFNGIDCHYEMYSRLLEDWIEAKALSMIAAHKD